MNSQYQSATAGGLAAEYLDDVAALPKIETIERFVHQQHFLRREKAERQKQAPIVAFRKGAHTFSQHRSQFD